MSAESGSVLLEHVPDIRPALDSKCLGRSRRSRLKSPQDEIQRQVGHPLVQLLVESTRDASALKGNELSEDSVLSLKRQPQGDARAFESDGRFVRSAAGCVAVEVERVAQERKCAQRLTHEVGLALLQCVARHGSVIIRW